MWWDDFVAITEFCLHSIKRNSFFPPFLFFMLKDVHLELFRMCSQHDQNFMNWECFFRCCFCEFRPHHYYLLMDENLHFVYVFHVVLLISFSKTKPKKALLVSLWVMKKERSYTTSTTGFLHLMSVYHSFITLWHCNNCLGSKIIERLRFRGSLQVYGD